MRTLKFSALDRQTVEMEFGVRQVINMPELSEWLSVGNEPFSDEDVQSILACREELELNVIGWNETELLFKFINPFLASVKFKEFYPFNYFLYRNLSATLGSVTLSGNVDFMLAKGRDWPIAPYFCLHKYKRSYGEMEPNGQLLGELIAVRAINHDNGLEFTFMPGVVIVGAIWRFIALKGAEYAISRAYDAISNQTHSTSYAYYVKLTL